MIRPRNKHNERGFVLPMSIIMVGGITILLIGLMAVLTLERKTARAYTNATRADLAIESGVTVAVQQISSFLSRTDVSGAAFTTWAYHPGGESNPGSLLALTSGRSQFDMGNTAGTPYLSTANTTWLGITDNDPDKLYADFLAGNRDVIDLNANDALGALTGACLARWQTIGSDAQGNQIRYAIWVDDESSRIDVTQIGTKVREDGSTSAEVPFYGAGMLTGADAAKPPTWRTGDSATVLGNTKFPKELSFVSTAFNRGYDVLSHTPSFADLGVSVRNGYQLPLRGRLKRNLNWNGHLSQGNVDQRVERLTEWMANGAQGFFNKRNLTMWTGSGTNAPNYQTLPTANPFASNLRMEQFRTIAASLIDYLDSDSNPTQPTSLTALNYGNPAPGASPVLLMRDVPRPAYFGADRNIRINEVQIIWNSRGLADGYQARSNVTRTSLPGGLFRYEIPVTYRFELWNMDDNPIPATSYEIRSNFMQQILSSTFGAIGSLPIPEETEIVFALNSGSPIAFAPNEIKVFDITRVYLRNSSLNRGTTWNDFRNGGAGTGDDQPDGHQRQAYVLLDANTRQWLHATNYLQMDEAPTDGVVSAGLGNRGTSKGNRINDPRMTPLRMYDSTSGLHFHEADRDWSGNKPGRMGEVNNTIAGHNYQDFTFWLDRPYLQNINTPLQGVTRVENRPMRSIGELGRIFDPSWTHPAGRGASNSPLNRGLFSPFRGGGTLATGFKAQATQAGTAEADHLDAKPWNIMDIFSIQGDGSTMTSDEFGNQEWRGRINLNCQKNFSLNNTIKTNHELIMELPALRMGAAGRPTTFDFKALATELKNRVTKGAKRSDGTDITNWKQATPLYSSGQLSELDTWSKTNAFSAAESSALNELNLINRSDYAREEAMMRSANLVTTRSHCYRVIVAGEVLDSLGKVVGRRIQENVIFFRCTWDSNTGQLQSLNPQILYVRSL